jgi:hypothetical protein
MLYVQFMGSDQNEGIFRSHNSSTYALTNEDA